MTLILEYNYLKIRYLIITIFTISYNTVSGQIFDNSQNPPGLKWQQINTQNFQVIYPSGFEEEAQRVASTLPAILGKATGTYRKTPRKISLILQNQGTSSNGFVQLAPRRSEFFTTPAQEFDSQDWLNSLAVHELRHIVQFDKLTGYLHPPLEGLALAIFGVTLPPWFYEGDAVMTETSLTRAGRGRQPEFDLVLRTNTLSGRSYSYSKNYLGSFKNFTPDYYPLGYLMTRKLVRDQGPGIVDSIMERIAKNPLRPYSFSSAVKKFSGFGTRQLHDATVKESEVLWTRSASAKTYPVVNKKHPGYPLNYFMPAALRDGTIAAIRKGPGKAPALIAIDKTGRERILRKIGLQEDAYFRYAAGMFVWDEHRYDPRFHKRSYNVIMLMDEHTGKAKQITHRSRLFAPALSPTATSIIAVDVDYSNHISLVELSLAGEILRRFDSPGNVMLQTPSWNPAGKNVVVAGVSGEGKTLYELSVDSGRFTQLFPPQEQMIARPVYIDDHRIAYKAHYNGRDDIYLYDTRLRGFSRLTATDFGAYNPSFNATNNTLLFNNYDADGMNIASSAIQPEAISLLPKNTASPVNDVFYGIPDTIFPSKPYRELEHLVYAHSLIPIAAKNAIYDKVDYGLKLQSDNKLNTMSMYAGYRFNRALRKNEYLAGFTYSRFLPVLNVSYENQARFFYEQQLNGATPSFIPNRWRENSWEAKLSIPLIMNYGAYTYTASAEAGTAFVNRYQYTGNPVNFIRMLRFPMSYRIALARNSLRSARDIAPRWGQSISLMYRHLPFQAAIAGSLLTFKSNFYFPGLAANHSLQVSFNARNAAGIYDSMNDIPTVAGYTSLPYSGMLRNTLLTGYYFPLLYPDWEIGPLAYIKRIRGGVFADFENAFTGKTFRPRSYGIELKADMNLLRFYLPGFTFGAKMIFTPSPLSPHLLETGLTYNY
jgi:hypothetical protein